jgi:FixJ family two-component response regulator
VFIANQEATRMSKVPISDATVYIVDADAVLRTALQDLLLAHGQPVRTFAGGAAFLAACAPHWHGCVLLDLQGTPMSGFEVFGRMKAMGIGLPTLFLSTGADGTMMGDACRHGSIDVIEKPVDEQTLLGLVDHYLARDRDRHQRRCRSAAIATRMQALTPREREVMGRIVTGKLNKQIADELQVGIKTVEVHRSRVMEKMAVTTLAELIRGTIDAALLDDQPTTR